MINQATPLTHISEDGALIVSIPPVDRRPLRRYIGKCAGCKRVYSAKLTRAGTWALGADGGIVYATSTGTELRSIGGSLSPALRCTGGCLNLKGTAGRAVRLEAVKGTYNAAKRCDARCENAKGHTCECSCGGEHHGAGWGV